MIRFFFSRLCRSRLIEGSLTNRTLASPGTLTFFSFRDKEKSGWRGYSARLTFEDGSVVPHNDITGSFIEIFRYDVCLRQSCTECPFASKHRQGDITIGDFWGIEAVMPEFSDNEGISAVMLNSDKGKALFDESFSVPIEVGTGIHVL